jgi:hypothetical protein
MDKEWNVDTLPPPTNTTSLSNKVWGKSKIGFEHWVKYSYKFKCWYCVRYSKEGLEIDLDRPLNKSAIVMWREKP